MEIPFLFKNFINNFNITININNNNNNNNGNAESSNASKGIKKDKA